MIFGRKGVLASKFAAVFDDWNVELERSALAHNLKFDDRVSAAREQSLKEVWEDGTRRDEKYSLHDAVVAYKKTRVYTPHDPEFLDAVRNRDNLPGAAWLPPMGRPLSTILDLDRLVGLFQKDWLTTSAGSPFADYTDVSTYDPDRFHRWLTESIERDGQEFLEGILDLLNEDLRQSRSSPGPGVMVYPFWASVVKDVDDVDLSRICQMTGLPINGEAWVCLLQVPAERAGTPVRPTQLEAGASAIHFPTPKKLPWSIGGHPVDLHPGEAVRQLLKEFLYYPISWEHGDIQAWGRVRLGDHSLVEVREWHLRRLRQEYPNDCANGWMEPHIHERFL